MVRDGVNIGLYVNGLGIDHVPDGTLGGQTGVALQLVPYTGQPTADVRYDNFGLEPLYGAPQGGTAQGQASEAPLPLLAAPDYPDWWTAPGR